MTPTVDTPVTQYTTTPSGVHLAYQVAGDGPTDLVFMRSWGTHLEIEWELPALARFLERLASFSRLIRLDLPGNGLSDPVDPRRLPTLEERAACVRTVLDAVGSDRASIVACESAGYVGLYFAATYPDRTSALVLAGTYARLARAPDYPFGLPARMLEARVAHADDIANATARDQAIIAPSMVGDAEFEAWHSRLARHTNSPAMMDATTRMTAETDVRHVLPTIRARTLVLSRTGDHFVRAEYSRYLAEHIPGAQLVTLDGIDNAVYVGDSDAVLDEIEEFLTGVRGGPSADRVLATVLFTDIVDSTARAAELGDRRWRDVLDAHDAAVRRQLARFAGREVNTAGDGFLAVFDGPGRAIRCARAVCDVVRGLGLEVRAGLHTGEVEVRGDDVAGLAVHIGARVAARAAAGEVLVSGAVPPLVAGSGLEFDDLGEHELKGVPGAWRLLAVRER